jgi:amphi-Trp domain-containing protein
MKQHKKNFRHDSLQDRQSILNILHAVTEGLEQGNLILSDDDDEIALTLAGLMQLKLTASQEDNKYTLALKVSWQTEANKTPKKNTLHVFSKPPS